MGIWRIWMASGPGISCTEGYRDRWLARPLQGHRICTAFWVLWLAHCQGSTSSSPICQSCPWWGLKISLLIQDSVALMQCHSLPFILDNVWQISCFINSFKCTKIQSEIQTEREKSSSASSLLWSTLATGKTKKVRDICWPKSEQKKKQCQILDIEFTNTKILNLFKIWRSWLKILTLNSSFFLQVSGCCKKFTQVTLQLFQFFFKKALSSLYDKHVSTKAMFIWSLCLSKSLLRPWHTNFRAKWSLINLLDNLWIVLLISPLPTLTGIKSEQLIRLRNT